MESFKLLLHPSVCLSIHHPSPNLSLPPSLPPSLFQGKQCWSLSLLPGSSFAFPFGPLLSSSLHPSLFNVGGECPAPASLALLEPVAATGSETAEGGGVVCICTRRLHPAELSRGFSSRPFSPLRDATSRGAPSATPPPRCCPHLSPCRPRASLSVLPWFLPRALPCIVVLPPVQASCHPVTRHQRAPLSAVSTLCLPLILCVGFGPGKLLFFLCF